MLATVIALLITMTGFFAVLVIADSALKARRAYQVLVREAAGMKAGLESQTVLQPVRVRCAPGNFKPIRRGPGLTPLALTVVPACAAA